MDIKRGSELEKTYLEMIENYRKKLERVIYEYSSARQSEYRKAFKKICEIESLEVRVFVVAAFVNELDKTTRELKNLLRSE